jgi:hypothetical protein
MKDFFDIWLLSRQFDFDGATLAKAIQKTFSNRGTTITAQPTAFSADFATDAGKVSQWQAVCSQTAVGRRKSGSRQRLQSDFEVSFTTSGSCPGRIPVSWAVAQCRAMD